MRFADFDIGQQAEHRAAPISAPPGRRVVEALIAGLRQAFRHVAHHRLPDFPRIEVAGLHPRDRLDIDGQSLRKPGVAIRHVGQRGVHHLVHHHPVALQDILGGIAAERNANGGAAIAPRRAAADAPAIDGHQQQPQRGDGKPPVIGRDGAGRHPDPAEQLFLRQRDVARRERDMDGAAGYFEVGLGQPVERLVGHAVAAHIFRLRVGAERQRACQHRGEDGGGNGPAKGAGGFHLSTLCIGADCCGSAPCAMNAAACSWRSSSIAASKASPLAAVARVGSPKLPERL